MSATVARRAGAFAAALVVSGLGISGCGNDDGPGRATPSKASPAAPTTPATALGAGAVPLLIRNRVTGFDGTVLSGSTLGEASFCPGGTVRHEQGSPLIGFPAINGFTCTDGALRIGFGPGPDQQENRVQTSAWRVLDGTGRYAGATGEGRMVVAFADGEPVRGQETFLGLITLADD